MRSFAMTDQAAAAQVCLLMFYWVPFALGAYLVEHWSEERWRQHLFHPIRYIGEIRHTVAPQH
jgi:hypothetical protein